MCYSKIIRKETMGGEFTFSIIRTSGGKVFKEAWENLSQEEVETKIDKILNSKVGKSKWINPVSGGFSVLIHGEVVSVEIL